jgi:hypothetical protein
VSDQSSSAIRLTFAYEDDSIDLISQQPVDMIVPPSDPIEDLAASGFRVDLKDSEGETLYRRVMHNPIPVDREVFSDEPAQSVSRIPVERPKGVFTIVVPNVTEAQVVSLYSSRIAPESVPRALRVLKTFELTRSFESIK